MSDTKTLSYAALLSITSGVLLCDFDEFHEAVEWVAGHPVWTHELGDPGTVAELRAAALLIAPKCADFDKSGITRDNYRERVVEFVESNNLPYFVVVPKREATRVESPMESAERMFGGKPIVGVDGGEA